MDSTQVTEYERALVATALKHAEGVNALLDLDPTDFYNQPCRLIVQTIKEQFLNNVPIDLVTTSNNIPLADDGTLDRQWWRVHLTDLVLNYDFQPTSLDYYKDAIREASKRRKLARINKKLSQEIVESDESAGALIATHLQEIAAITAEGEREQLVHISTLTADTITRIKERELDPAEVIGTPTGIIEFDRLTTGFQPGQLILIGARPSMGKSSLALCWAAHMAIMCGLNINFFSLEMSRFTLIQKLIAMYTGLSTNLLRTGVGLNAWHWDQIDRAIHQINKSGLYIADQSARITKVSHIRAKYNEQKLKGVKVHGQVADHIGLLYPEKETDNRVQAVSEISRDLKVFSAEEDLFTLALCQLGRGVEQRQDKRPMLSDLRESGSLEQDADIVTFIYRDEYYNKESDKRGDAELIIAKQREGATGTVDTIYTQSTQIFSSKSGALPYGAPPIPEQFRQPPQEEEQPPQTNFEPPAQDLEREVMPISQEQIQALVDNRGIDAVYADCVAELSAVQGGTYEDVAVANLMLAEAMLNKIEAPTVPPEPAEPSWY